MPLPQSCTSVTVTANKIVNTLGPGTTAETVTGTPTTTKTTAAKGDGNTETTTMMAVTIKTMPQGIEGTEEREVRTNAKGDTGIEAEATGEILEGVAVQSSIEPAKTGKKKKKKGCSKRKAVPVEESAAEVIQKLKRADCNRRHWSIGSMQESCAENERK